MGDGGLRLLEAAVPRVNPGRLNTFVTLSEPIEDGTPVTFSPARVKGELLSDGVGSESAIFWSFITRFHPQITTHTQLTLDDGRMLSVMDFGNAGNADRSGWMVLRCQEVQTP